MHQPLLLAKSTHQRLRRQKLTNSKGTGQTGRKQNKSDKSILLGDLNANPYSAEIANAKSLNATMRRYLAVRFKSRKLGPASRIEDIPSGDSKKSLHDPSAALFQLLKIV